MTKLQRAQRRAERDRHAAIMAARHREAQRIVATGKCPQCGCGIKRNLSMTGWWQCEQFGAPSFRKDPTAPDCNWQTFTE